jgi:hypothetical protein
MIVAGVERVAMVEKTQKVDEANIEVVRATSAPC